MSRFSLWGPLSALGVSFAALIFVSDQAVKWLVLGPLGLESRREIYLTPIISFRMAWNHGVSYGFLTTHAQAALIALSLAITAALWAWLAQVRQPLGAAALGLVIGGALSNALDRAVHGAVADFFYFPFLQHVDFAPLQFVFNLADVAIVAGVALLLYESFAEPRGPQGH